MPLQLDEYMYFLLKKINVSGSIINSSEDIDHINLVYSVLWNNESNIRQTLSKKLSKEKQAIEAAQLKTNSLISILQDQRTVDYLKTNKNWMEFKPLLGSTRVIIKYDNSRN